VPIKTVPPMARNHCLLGNAGLFHLTDGCALRIFTEKISE
jgi:hypothetical protein